MPMVSAADKIHNVVILGSGPAGLTAAIYTARATLEPLMIEGEADPTGDQPGGQLMLTTDIENFPGFPDGIEGPELMQRFRQQAECFGTTIVSGAAIKVDLSERPFSVWTAGLADSDMPIKSHSLIIATGAHALHLNVPGEERLIGHGVSTCATCDGFFFRDQNIAVVGGGDSALEEAIFLTHFARRVTVIHRRDEFRASRIMVERAAANEKISFLLRSRVLEVVGSTRVEGLKVENVRTGSESMLGVTGLFIAIGHEPNSGIFKGQLELDSNGYIITQPNSSRTNVHGVFACGDVQDRVYRQAVTAAGTGCMAALDAEHWIRENVE
ncbi:MAG: thioredoxin-disulfide reductase [Actinobacteria bacterium]|nr:thioredoxin-disulfide reductase [Actinomycetota bacterium]MCL5445935.1 thioredoxin-disulfide reductase [Actinomycetota bacterium]